MKRKLTEGQLRAWLRLVGRAEISMSKVVELINEYFYEKSFKVGDTVYSKRTNVSYLIVFIDNEGLPHFPKYKYYLKNIEYGSYVWATENDIVKL